MKKIIFLSIAVIAALLLVFSGCTGLKGNPTELTGIWSGTFNNGATTTTYTYEFTDQAAFTATRAITNGTKTVATGSFYGDPYSQDKTVTLEVTQQQVTPNGGSTTTTTLDQFFSSYYKVVYINSKNHLQFFATTVSAGLADPVYSASVDLIKQ